MAMVLLFIDKRPDQGGDGPYHCFGGLEFSRVPCKAEYVHLGHDASGHSADYEVVLVHHRPRNIDEIDAHIYMKRVNMTDVRNRCWPDEPLTSTSWKSEDWPTIKPER
jgi:hypothetical protein